MIFRHLQYFVSVAEHRSFTAAAYALNITQPSISQQIADLEKLWFKNVNKKDL